MGDISPNFSRWEFECKCKCGYDTVDIGLIDILEDVRTYFGKPVSVNSGCRCIPHNRAEGGAERSTHAIARGADIEVEDVQPDDVADYLEDTYPTCHGIGRYDSFTHVDSRSNKARWDKRKEE